MTFPTFDHILWADLETRSGIPINRGAHVYSDDSALLLFLYALDEGPVQVWDAACGQPIPEALHWALSNPRVQLRFHHTDFDRTVLSAWPAFRQYNLEPWRFYCTMRKARVAGLPGSLDELCRVLQIPETYAKKDGNALIRLFCIPDDNGVYAQPSEHPAEWQRFCAYGVHDVIAMREASRRTPDVYSEDEQVFAWYTDLMNDRGLPIDRELCHKAMLLAADLKKEAKRISTDALRADGWAIDEFNPHSQKAILQLAAEYGVKLEDAKGATLEKLLDGGLADLLPPTLRIILNERVRTNKSAVTKFGPMISACNPDGRARGLVSYYGANRTGRDSGRRVQGQNMARPKIVGEVAGWDQATAVELIKNGSLMLHTDKPMQVLADCTRAAIAAPAGRKFCIADLAAIEGRKLPWLAGESWMLEYYRKLDAGIVKYDTYKLAYATVFGVDPETVVKSERQLGKVIELFAGYGGGVGALVTFAALFRQNIAEISEAAWLAGDPHLMRECWESFAWFEAHDLTYGYDQHTWTGLQYIVKAWRAKRPATAASWAKCGEAFTNAIRNPGQWFPMARDTWVVNNLGANFVRLPSGRFLVYPQAHVTNPESKRPGLAFYGVNPFTRRWGLIYTHGARICENITQASSRDVLFYHIPQAEAEGYAIVNRVHDELVTETPDTPQFTGARLAQIIKQPHNWCLDLPLNAVGEESYRYS